MLIKICGEYGVSNDLTKWRNQKYSQRGKVKLGKLGNQARHILMKIHSPEGLLRNQMVSLCLESTSYQKQFEVVVL